MDLDALKKLRLTFEPNQISKLPKPTSKDAPKGHCKECGGYHGLPAVHLDYVGHAALTDRLLDVDQTWSWEPFAVSEIGLPLFDASGGLWIRLTICGVTRIGYGHAASKSYMDPGAREKEVIGDALRNAAMRFGAALDLWHKGDLHKDQHDDELDAIQEEKKALQEQEIAKSKELSSAALKILIEETYEKIEKNCASLPHLDQFKSIIWGDVTVVKSTSQKRDDFGLFNKVDGTVQTELIRRFDARKETIKEGLKEGK